MPLSNCVTWIDDTLEPAQRRGYYESDVKKALKEFIDELKLFKGGATCQKDLDIFEKTKEIFGSRLI